MNTALNFSRYSFLDPNLEEKKNYHNNNYDNEYIQRLG